MAGLTLAALRTPDIIIKMAAVSAHALRPNLSAIAPCATVPIKPPPKNLVVGKLACYNYGSKLIPYIDRIELLFQNLTYIDSIPSMIAV